jgi:4-amino-4-deoxy-L-arabinose transferase-like glycosyltransferase
MSGDPLKDLLLADEETSAVAMPASDLAFTVEVMARIERQQLRESLVLIGVLFVAVCGILAIVMPYLTPMLVAAGRELVPAVLVISVLGALAIGAQWMRPGLRMMGLPV